jgi:2-methylisocitrate lyase-like PEP mutase family enzyme
MSHDPGGVFRALHQPGDPFVLANAWDAGSARMLAALGAQAIGTTSAGYAFTLGRPDMGRVTRDEALAHAEALVSTAV